LKIAEWRNNIYRKNPTIVGFFSMLRDQSLFFYALQLISRLIFILHKKTAPISDFFQTSLHGFPLDLSMVCYALLPVLFILIFALVLNKKYVLYFSMALASVLVLFTLIISFSDAELYHVWGTKNNSQSIDYLKSIKEAMASSSNANWFIIVPFTFGIFIFMFRIYWLRSKSFRWNYLPRQRRILLLLSILALLPCGIGVRGGLQTIPISQSSVYFSHKSVKNYAAVNSSWNFLFYLVNSRININPENYRFDGVQGTEWKTYLGKPTEKFMALSSKNKPNVILVVLESFSAYNSKFFKNSFNQTPFLDSLASTGWAFVNAYSQGDRTDKGLACIFGGWPGQPWQSIINDPDKAAKLPSLAKGFENEGYSRSFFYGGDLAFANMNAYLRNAGFEDLQDVNSIQGVKHESKWGFHDEFVFANMLKVIESQKQPFFNAILTLSSHEPFDVPGSEKVDFKDDYAKFRYSVTYTDAVLRKFIHEASHTPWFQNTLFVFVADHGRNIGLPHMDYYQPAHFSVPIIFWGPALNPKLNGIADSSYCGQTDIGATLLSGLFRKNKTFFPYGRNLLGKEAGTAVYFFTDGFGVLSQNGHVVWENNPPRVTEKSGKAFIDLLNLGKSMQYSLVKEFKKY